MTATADVTVQRQPVQLAEPAQGIPGRRGHRLRAASTSVQRLVAKTPDPAPGPETPEAESPASDCLAESVVTRLVLPV